MTLTDILFYGMAILTAGSGLVLALSRSVIYAAFMLFGVLLCVAGMYVFAGAEFLAVSQIIVYVGGTLIVVLFGVMLTTKLRELRPETELINVIPGALLAISLFFALLFVIRESGVAHAPAVAYSLSVENTKAIGKATVTDFLLPFELISILLLTILVGAAYLSRRMKTEKEENA